MRQATKNIIEWLAAISIVCPQCGSRVGEECLPSDPFHLKRKLRNHVVRVNEAARNNVQSVVY